MQEHLSKNNRLMPIKQDPPLGHILDCRRQHITLDIAARMGQLLGAQRMVHPHHILLDDRPLIQITRHKVRRGANDLNTSVIRLVVRLRALETRQEAVVDVDDAPGHGLAQHRRQHLHVPRQHDQVDLVFAHQLQDARLLLLLCVRRDGQVHERHVVGCGEGREVRVVGDDQGHLDGELAGGLPEEEVVEAVADLGDHDQHAGLLGGGVDRKVHGQGLGGWFEGGAQFLDGQLGVLVCGLGSGGGGSEVHAHKEALRGGIAELR